MRAESILSRRRPSSRAIEPGRTSLRQLVEFSQLKTMAARYGIATIDRRGGGAVAAAGFGFDAESTAGPIAGADRRVENANIGIGPRSFYSPVIQLDTSVVFARLYSTVSQSPFVGFHFVLDNDIPKVHALFIATIPFFSFDFTHTTLANYPGRRKRVWQPPY